MTGHMDYFRFYVCSQDVGCEKPHEDIFQKAYEEAQFWLGPLEKDEILHIGDSLEADYCGARAFGFQALHLDRSDNERVTVYQDWLTAPEYPGKSQDDIRENTVKDLSEVRVLLERRRGEEDEKQGAALAAEASSGYHDSNEVDKTGVEGHVTMAGEQISAHLPAVVRGELIECATDESDITEEAWQ